MFYLTSFESYSDESEHTYLVLCFLLLFLLLRLTSDGLVSTSDETVYTTLNYVLNTMNTDTTVQKLLQEFRYIVRQIYATKLGHTVRKSSSKDTQVR
jgi:hypothetical protein